MAELQQASSRSHSTAAAPNGSSAATGGFRATFKSDLLASIVVFLVALPLCMGVALACGVPIAAGIITGIVGGIVVGMLAGSPLQVSGPPAGLIVLVWALVQDHGLGALGVVVFLAGAIQLIAGIARLGQWFRAVSPAVIQGMLAGIGALIFVSQFHLMIDDSPKGSGWENIRTLPEAVWKGVFPLDGSAHHLAAQIGILTISILAFWKAVVPGRLKSIPAPLVAVVVATTVAQVMGLPIKLVALPDTLLTAITWPTMEWFSQMMQQSLLMAAVAIAVVASAETLLCATAVDQMQQDVRTKYDKELAAQGVGNMLCGLMGALPMTGVIVRSAANVESGAKTRLSTILHGVWLLTFVSVLPTTLELIPTSTLAAILVFTGYKLMSPKAIRVLWRFGKGEALIYLITMISIVATDLLTGVLVGVGCSVVKLLLTFSRLSVTTIENDGERTILRLRGAATFIRLPKLAAALENVPPNTELHVDFEGLTYIDHACLDLLMNWEKQHEATGGSLVIDWEALTARFRQRRLPLRPVDPLTPADPMPPANTVEHDHKLTTRV